MPVDLSDNFFKLFGFKEQYAINQEELVSKFRELQLQLHPDRFATASDAERRWSLQAASLANDAYQTLSSDLPRAIYLLKLQGVNTDDETDTSMPAEFLMMQMELRESLEAAESSSEPYSALEKVRLGLKQSLAEQRENYQIAAEAADWTTARDLVRQWQFLDKMVSEVKRSEERLDELV